MHALRTLGATNCATIVQNILASFPNGAPLYDDADRLRQVEVLRAGAEAMWTGS